MTETEPVKKAETELKLKAKMTHMDEMNYTLQVSPVNGPWRYSEAESEYKISEYLFKSEDIRQIVRNVLFKYKEILVDSVKVGSKEYLFEIQVPKRMEKEKLKLMFTQITTEIKNEISKSRTELETFKKFLEDTEF